MTASQHNIFDSEKCIKFFLLVLLTGFELGSWYVESNALLIEPLHPVTRAMIDRSNSSVADGSNLQIPYNIKKKPLILSFLLRSILRIILYYTNET